MKTQLFTIIEMSDIEISSVRHFQSKAHADKCFEAIMEENLLHEWDDLSREIEGTVRGAGDDAYSVTLLSKAIEA